MTVATLDVITIELAAHYAQEWREFLNSGCKGHVELVYDENKNIVGMKITKVLMTRRS